MKKYNLFVRVVLICFLFFLFEENVKADTGCLYNGQVYRVSPTWFNWFWSSPMQASCPVNATPATLYAKVDPGSGASCPISWSASGREVSYRIDNCPLDDYMPVLFLITAGTGLFFLRKRFICQAA